MNRFKNYGRGVRRIPGQMNKLEKKYADHLEEQRIAGNIQWFVFDALKLRLAEKTFYTPDFLVMNNDGTLDVHEVKGTSKGKPFVEDDAAVKIKVAAALFPFRFFMIWNVKGEWMSQGYSE